MAARRIAILIGNSQFPAASGLDHLRSPETYAYGLQAVSGVPSEDDDGNHASPQQTETNKDNNQDSNQDVNWYITFEQDKQAMISDIRSGKKPDDIIRSLQGQGLAINKKIREQIKGLKE